MWIDLDGLANMRDVGGIPTIDGGKIVPGRLLRSDNLQTLTTSDVDQLLGLGLTDVIDLRSDYEARRGAHPARHVERTHPALLAVSRMGIRCR
jgi:protein tyrosine/serine phosphatase